MARLNRLTPRPPDALIGLMTAFREDPREDKIDLGVGVYRDPDGNTPVFAAVREAERRMAEEQTTKVYEGPRGNTDFTDQIAKMVLGASANDDRLLGFTVPGGTGGLYLGMQLLRRLEPAPTIWMGDPTWPNHPHIAASVDLEVKRYPYAKPSDPGVDLDAMIEGFSGAQAGDAVLVQGPCHNPTGIDLKADEWAVLGDALASRGLIPFIDCAYHGFATSLEEDAVGIKTLFDRVPEAILVYSCSKNFGLYRERCGAAFVKAETKEAADATATHLADIGRATWSMPPAHGAAIVATILGDEGLTKMWEDELTAMRERMNQLRADLAAALSPRGNSYDPSVLNAQNGMFSQLPISKADTEALRGDGVYMPGSGRINIAGLTTEIIPRAAELLSTKL